MRAFIALELPEDFKEDLAAMTRVLSSAVEGRFIPRENYHVTLAFLGDIDEAQAHDVMDAMDEACVGMPRIPLRADRLGKFGRSSDATLWLGLAPDPALIRIANQMREALRAQGFALDDKPFLPHITLARRTCLPKGALPELAFPHSCDATHVTLFKSTLSHEGAQYKPLYEIDLSQG